MTVVDAHLHVLPPRVVADIDTIAHREPWFAACHTGRGRRVASVGDALAAMDRAGVDRAVCFAWPFADPRLCAEANDWLAGEVRRHADRLVGFGTVNPADPGAGREAERCARLGLRGLGELNADAQGWSLDDRAAVAPVAAASVAAGLVWNLHCSEPVGHLYPGKGTATPDRLARLADAEPELRIVAAHLGGGLPFYAHMPEVRELCRRLWFDTAAAPLLYRPSAYAAVVALVGADRLLLGTDFPLLDARRYLPALREAGLGERELAEVCGGSARRLLG